MYAVHIIGPFGIEESTYHANEIQAVRQVCSLLNSQADMNVPYTVGDICIDDAYDYNGGLVQAIEIPSLESVRGF